MKWLYYFAIWIPDQLKAYTDLILPLFFVCFFFSTLVAILFNRNKYIRKSFVVGFIVLFLIVNIAGPVVLPLMHWWKFSEPYSESRTHYEIRVVDTNDDELIYDHRATLAVDGVTMRLLTEKMVTEYSEEKNEEIACHLLQRAKIHREQVQTRTVFYLLRFPPHGLNNMWTESKIENYSSFSDIRLYKITINTSRDGTEVTSHSEEIIHSYPTPCTETD